MARQKDRAILAKPARGEDHVSQLVQKLRQLNQRQVEQVNGFVETLTAAHVTKTPRQGWTRAFRNAENLNDPGLQDSQHIRNHWDDTEWIW